MTPRRVCVVTGSRAEYGLLWWLLHDLRDDSAFDLQLIVTGMHLAPEFGHTVDEIERDGFVIARRVDMLVAGDTGVANAKSIGLGTLGMADALHDLRPGLVVVLGDRFEILAAVQACLMLAIPVVHLCGGDVTEGAFDESIRHAITKMSHVHLVSNELSARRVRAMGEDPARVHVVGSPGLDHLRRAPLLDRVALEAALGAPLGTRNLLVTFHPVTLQPGESAAQLDELLAALDALPPNVALWFTQSNADAGGRALTQRLQEWIAPRAARARLFASLGQARYLALMAQADAVVGNSSSGLYEAPSFGVPTVDIGDRQRGRLAADSVIHCEPRRDDIARALQLALAQGKRDTVNPYGDGRSTARILDVLRALPEPGSLLRKPFHLVEAAP